MTFRELGLTGSDNSNVSCRFVADWGTFYSLRTLALVILTVPPLTLDRTFLSVPDFGESKKVANVCSESLPKL